MRSAHWGLAARRQCRRFYTPTQAEALEFEFGVEGVAGVLMGAVANRHLKSGWELAGVCESAHGACCDGAYRYLQLLIEEAPLYVLVLRSRLDGKPR